MADVSVSLKSILGIDIGSVSLYIVQLDAEGKILRRFNQFHKGNIREAFSEAKKIFDLSQIESISCTSSSIFLNKKLIRIIMLGSDNGSCCSFVPMLYRFYTLVPRNCAYQLDSKGIINLLNHSSCAAEGLSRSTGCKVKPFRN
jgi:hypothetical protein